MLERWIEYYYVTSNIEQKKRQLTQTKNIAEEYVNLVNENIFFKEFTFTENDIKLNDKNEVQLADNIVWLDEYLFLIQIKWRNPIEVKDSISESKWFNNKVLGVAKRQIKKTIAYFKDNTNLVVTNNAGFKVNLSDAPLNLAFKLIIYLPDEKLSSETKLIKFYDSKDSGLIHLFQFEDYKWICQYLITICEISRYLEFREQMQLLFGNEINKIPEQLILGKFLSGKEISRIDFSFLKYFTNLDENINDFDFLPYLKIFRQKTIYQKNQTDYISVVKEIAKLTRFELKEFKLRFNLSIEKSKSTEYTLPYRFTIPRLNCSFLFVPLDLENKKFRDDWQNVLKQFIWGNMYDQKADKCIAVIIFRYPETKESIEVYWMKSEFEWEYDKEMEKSLKEFYPFRKTQIGLKGGYKFKE